MFFQLLFLRAVLFLLFPAVDQKNGGRILLFVLFQGKQDFPEPFFHADHRQPALAERIVGNGKFRLETLHFTTERFILADNRIQGKILFINGLIVHADGIVGPPFQLFPHQFNRGTGFRKTLFRFRDLLIQIFDASGKFAAFFGCLRIQFFIF